MASAGRAQPDDGTVVHRITGLWQGQRLVVIGYLGLMVEGWLRGESLGKPLTGSWEISLGCLACTQRARFAYGRNEPWVQVERQADGSYYAEMCGHFSLRVSGDEPFRMRLLILFLRWLEVAGPERVIGRTRDDRALWGIVQGGVDPEVRRRSAGETAGLVSERSSVSCRGELPSTLVK